MSFGIIITLILCAVIGIVAFSQMKSKRGRYGERLVSLIIRRLPSAYHVFDDVRIYVAGRKCQIDHLIVSPYGIFVIETKSYLGLTTGNGNDAMWYRRVLGKRYKTRNSLLQNEYHLEMLGLKLGGIDGFSQEWLKSVVVFTFGSKILINGENKNVLMFYHLLSYIKSFEAILISPRSLQDILKVLNRTY